MWLAAERTWRPVAILRPWLICLLATDRLALLTADQLVQPTANRTAAPPE